MAIESDAIRSHAEFRRLADIMQQRSPGEGHRARIRQVVEKKQRVYKHVAFGMKLGRLLNSLHRRNLRQNWFQQTAFIQQEKSAPGVPFRQHARQFVANPLARHDLDLLSQFLCGRKCSWLNRVLEPRRESDCAQHAQLVFSETLLSIPDGTDDSRFQILARSYKIEHLAADRIKQHSVDREIAARYIFPRIPAESHFVRMAA